MFSTWKHNGHEYRKYDHSYTLKISSHALERMERRDVEKDATSAVIASFVASEHILVHQKGDRIGIRSTEGLIVVIGIEKIKPDKKYRLCVCTVWNTKRDGTFFCRKGMEIYDFEQGRQGVLFSKADEKTIARQSKYVHQKG